MRASEFITEKKSRKKTKVRHAAYGPGLYGGYGYAVGYSGDMGAGDGGESINNEVQFGGQEVEGNAYEKFKDKFPNLSTVLYFIPGLSQALVAADMASAVHMYNQAIAQIEQKYPLKIIRTVQLQVGDDQPLEPFDENFADGKNPQDKGDSKRHGVPTKASVSTLRKVAKQGGRKGQLAHWMANMKAGKKK